MRPRILVAGLIAVPTLVVGLSACTGESTSKPDATEDVAADSYEWDVAFATCMRGRGIDMPDPKPGDDSPTKTQVDDQEKYEAATDACTDETEKGRGERPITAEKRQEMDQWNDVYEKTADCLRKKGYEVEVVDGGYSTDDTISPADSEECTASDSPAPSTDDGSH